MSGLQWAELNEGVNSLAWKDDARLFGMLVWAIQPEASGENVRDRLHLGMTDPVEKLPGLLESMISDGALVSKHLMDIKKAVQQQRSGIEIERVGFTCIDLGVVDSSAGIVEYLLADTGNLCFTDWYVFAESGAMLRKDSDLALMNH